GKVAVLKAARLFDGRTEKTTARAMVLIEGGRIAQVGAHIAVPTNAEVIDLGDATLLPGLMDAHTHITSESTRDWHKDQVDSLLRTVPEQSLLASVYAKRTIEAGFTTLRVLGSNDWADIGLRNAINAGIAEGPRLLVAGHAVSARGGHGDLDPYP